MLKSDCEAGAFCYHKMPLPDKFRTVGRPEKIRGRGTFERFEGFAFIPDKNGEGGEGLSICPPDPRFRRPCYIMRYIFYLAAWNKSSGRITRSRSGGMFSNQVGTNL